MGNLFTEALAAASGGLSALTAFVAVLIAVRAERRAREVTKAQLYLSLRDGFHRIYQELGISDASESDGIVEVTGADATPLAGAPAGPVSRSQAMGSRSAREAYWHHAFDEWYVARHLAPNEFGEMWNEFFVVALRSGYAHEQLRQVLQQLSQDPDEGFGGYAREFIQELERQLEPTPAG